MEKKKAIETALELLNNGCHQAFEPCKLEAQKVNDLTIEVTTKDKTDNCFWHIEQVAKVAIALDLTTYAYCKNNRVIITLY